MWAPDTATYGYDSRAASVRLLTAPGVPGYATRFEVRVPGADVSTSVTVRKRNAVSPKDETL